jgi:hypothetical protein
MVAKELAASDLSVCSVADEGLGAVRNLVVWDHDLAASDVGLAFMILTISLVVDSLERKHVGHLA